MFIYEFDRWCRQATKGIKYRPDRREVHWELYYHLEDRYQDFKEQGQEHDAAIQSALDAMGDPKEIAPMLAAIHRPFWGYMYSLSKWVLLAMTILVVWNFFPYMERQLFWQPKYNEFNPYEDTYFEDDSHIYERVLYTKPGCSDSSDGYTFTITDAAVWQLTCKTGHEHIWETNPYQFYCLLKVSNYRPWMTIPIGNSFVPEWFWAEDSLDNYYYSEEERIYSYDSSIGGVRWQNGPFTYVATMSSYDFVSMDAEWIELRYDRAGRDIALRIDLTGGEGQ